MGLAYGACDLAEGGLAGIAILQDRLGCGRAPRRQFNDRLSDPRNRPEPTGARRRASRVTYSMNRITAGVTSRPRRWIASARRVALSVLVIRYAITGRSSPTRR